MEPFTAQENGAFGEFLEKPHMPISYAFWLKERWGEHVLSGIVGSPGLDPGSEGGGSLPSPEPIF